MSRFDECFRLVVNIEGGYSNNPADRGGRTNYGITEYTLNAAYKAGLVSHNDITKLTMDDAKIIYKANYWNRCSCDSLPRHLDLCVFDTAVNCGVGTSGRLLQGTMNEIVGANILEVDGIIGPMTIGAVSGWLLRYKDTCTFPIIFLCDRFLDNRLEYYSNVVAKNNSQLTFLRGWLNRVLQLKGEMVKGGI